MLKKIKKERFVLMGWVDTYRFNVENAWKGYDNHLAVYKNEHENCHRPVKITVEYLLNKKE
jgi:hypothetical protein